MQNLASSEQVQSGCPVKISVKVQSPQNGHSSLENTPTLVEYSATIGSVQPQDLQAASQYLSQQLAQTALQTIQSQFQISQGQQFGSYQQQGQQQGQQGQQRWGQQMAAAGGSR